MGPPPPAATGPGDVIARTGSYERVVHQLGAAVCSGELAVGSTSTIEELEARTGASRSVVREAARVLGVMGLLRPRRRVGLEVLGPEQWNMLDPQVIRWRLSGAARDQQVQDLLNMRLAVEPEAARLAAMQASDEQAGNIMSAAGRLWATGLDGDQNVFLREDATFHALVLQASGNLMFGRLSAVVEEALRERALHQLHQRPVDRYDARLHVDLAHHIVAGRAAEAALAAREIIERNLSTGVEDGGSGTASVSKEA